ncbi:MAG: hypothetical protein A2V70_18415 [Planctomycetes bacterium RBG_13_63_9]|nr:MAG: hypothetical protein A2V70_18415 [Planctomycetes bacterium RBG_13_63_9]
MAAAQESRLSVTMRHHISPAFALSCLMLLALGDRSHDCLAGEWIGWRVSGPFVCRAEFPLTQMDGLLRELAEIQTDLVERLRVPPARGPIEIYLFRDQRSYQRYLKCYLPHVPYRRALYVKSDGPGRVFAYRSRYLETDLRHECTHALLHEVLPVVPLWLDEGLAEYFEVSARQRAFDNPHLGSLRWSLTLGAIPQLESLEKKGDLAEMNRADYRHAWAWVHFMLHGPSEAREELIGFLADIRASTPPGLLSQRLARRLPRTNRSLALHFKTWRR